MLGRNWCRVLNSEQQNFLTIQNVIIIELKMRDAKTDC